MAAESTLAVHRCRFVDYDPSALTALAYPPLPIPSSSKSKKPVAEGVQPPPRFGILAVGHANGNIDLCEWTGGPESLQSPQAWTIRKTLAGPYPSKIDSLAFILRDPEALSVGDVPSCSELRLFSSGGGSDLLEWDMERGCIRRTVNSQGGSIWSLAANPTSTRLALGCEDGTVRLIDVSNDSMTHYRRFDKVKCRILSIAWGPPSLKQKTSAQTTASDSDDEEDEDEWEDSWLVTGGSDSSIRKWDVSTRRVIERMGTDRVKGERTLVWAVGVLSDGTIVSGDSMGMVKFWDSRTCTQIQSFQGHGADVLCLAIGPEGTTVFTSGVDQKTTQFSFIKPPTADLTAPLLKPSLGKWVQSASRRLHSHDVRSLATWPPYAPWPSSHKRKFPADVAPVLASGGLDMSVVLTPIALPSSTTMTKIVNPLATSSECTFEESYQRRLAYFSEGRLRVARSARLLICLREREVSVWRILPIKKDGDEAAVDAEEKINGKGIEDGDRWEKVLDIELETHTNLVAGAISDDGNWLVVSDMYTAKLFSIKTTPKGDLKAKRIRDFGQILKASLPESSTSAGAVAFTFSPDSTKLIVSTALSSYVVIFDLSSDTPTVLRRFDHHCSRDAVIPSRVVVTKKTPGSDNDEEEDVEMGEPTSEEPVIPSVNYVPNVLRLEVSPDGQWLATSDDYSRTHVYNMDSLQHHCSLPSFPLPAQTIAFDPTLPSLLVLAFPNNTLQFYDVESRSFPSWSKQLSSTLSKQFTQAHDPVLGVTFDLSSSSGATPATPHYALFWGSTWLCKISLSDEAGASTTRRKRRRSHIPAKMGGGEEDPREFKMITHYRPILYVDFVASGELVVVERPLVDVLATLPPAYFRHKYGRS